VPPVYDTTRQPVDRGIHVHARSVRSGSKDIDATYRGVRLGGLQSDATVGTPMLSELDAIYFMVSSVFGYDIKYIECTYCGHPHLDKDWFSVHSHRRHLCAGCGKNFRDVDTAIGNPLARIRTALPHQTRSKRSAKKLNIRQADFPGGIQIWGSNPAIVWTSSEYEEEGIHVHAFNGDDSCPYPDETFSEVVIDGIKLDAIQVRTMMAQNSLPHLKGRVTNLMCVHCGSPHFAKGELGFAPSTTHRCQRCDRNFASSGRLRRVVSNPFVGVIERLAAHAVRPLQVHTLDLLPETL
jgi:transposase-like protein